MNRTTVFALALLATYAVLAGVAAILMARSPGCLPVPTAQLRPPLSALANGSGGGGRGAQVKP